MLTSAKKLLAMRLARVCTSLCVRKSRGKSLMGGDELTAFDVNKVSGVNEFMR